ncbi:MAG: plasmid pRiA4b ORF-3 family protein [Leptolyngbyaceae cyanobacterium SM2_5_2]|nr:plasmid pRiA4b ORF-3 family protein [Leptolyngbyaceae cyanobacterium SM2_5_2]
MQEKFNCITAITNDFAQQHLNEEYATLIRQATAALCRKRPSPLASGKDHTWACGISHAIGMANFLFDPSQDPHISAKELYAWFGVSASTGQAKSKQVRDALDISQMDPDWWLPSRMEDNPMAWLVSFNGMILDARTAPVGVQEQLAEMGLIPYAIGAADSSAVSSPPAPREPVEGRSPDAIYTLKVSIIEGPVTEEFAEENPHITRTIQIKGQQTLADLHRILFEAFDREEEHMYEFQVGGKGPQDPEAQRYGLSAAMDADLAGDVAKTTLHALGLAVEEYFGYWFDFGDDWWHMIEVMAIEDKASKGKYPKVIGRIGASPPQYADFE